MASSAVFSFKPTVSIRTRASSSGSGSGSKSPSARSGNWWTPIFGWSAQPDYMNSSGSVESHQPPAPEPAQKRYGVFTEEKARELRKRMLETESYHDAMYHSAIASRLASDFSRKKGTSA